MPIVAKTLVESKSVEQVQTTQYTVGVSATVLDKFTATNYSTVAQTLTVHLVPAGDMPAYSNMIVKTRTIQPQETYTFPELAGHILNTGDYISTLASLTASLNMRVSGREIS